MHTRFPDATIAVPRPPVPVYVELGQLFLGDRIMSYGGALRFTVEEEGGDQLAPELLDRFPLVRLYGRNLVLDYYEVSTCIIDFLVVIDNVTFFSKYFFIL